ncbi:hypothetical protein K0M31_016253, partial [Melipona bicolor]
ILHNLVSQGEPEAHEFLVARDYKLLNATVCDTTRVQSVIACPTVTKNINTDRSSLVPLS